VVASLLILLHATASSTGNLSLTDMNPASVVRVANRHVHLAYAHGLRFVNDLRFVYDIESLLAPPAPENTPAQPEQPAPSLDPRQKSKVVPHGTGRTAQLNAAAQRNPACDLEASLSIPASLYRSTP
jgi:hypothetical protein